ncbi:MAG TPA: 2-oxo acid dehydrogenase subunit E2 [Ktedonobacterales bacterium]
MAARHRQTTHSVPFPWIRVPIVDSLRAARRVPLMHALIEVDVTEARRSLRDLHRRSGVAVSFTGYLVRCVAVAVARHPQMQAHRSGRRHLVLYDDVDVCMPIEHDVGGHKQAAPYVLRQANRKSLGEIHREIRAAQAAGIGSAWAMRARRAYPWLPHILRTAFWRAFGHFPALTRSIGGTVMVTAPGMFGTGTGWGITPVSDYTLSIVVGSVSAQPAILDGQVVARDMLCLTITADHEVVDGAPMVRFIEHLKELIEGGYGLDALVAHPPTASDAMAPLPLGHA